MTTDRRPYRQRGRRRAAHLRVPVLPEEKDLIERGARTTGLSVAAYLRNLGLGYEPRSIVDNARVKELLSINADLGRMGGLLKLWLTDDDKLASYPEADAATAVRAALHRIEDTQVQLRSVIRRVIEHTEG